MFWNSAAATSVNFEELLKKENVTLQEIMDDDGVLQECKSQNNSLISYLVQSDILEKLVSLTIEEPTETEDDAVKYKYSNIACELLTCEVPSLTESLAKDKALLGKLYSFLDADAPLNPLLASFFSKTLSVLITRNSERNLYSYQFTCLKLLEFLKLKEDSISLLLKHLGTSAIMDLILKLVTEIEGADLKKIVETWLEEQKLIQRIVALLDPSVDPDRHHNAAQLLCDLINVLRIKKIGALQPNIILDIIESPEVVNLILDHLLKEPRCESSIVGGISVLLVLLEDKWVGNDRIVFDETRRCYVDYLKVVASTAKAILPRLKVFHDILINPPAKSSVRTTITVLDPPLGIVRVEVTKLFSALITKNNEDINKKLIELGTLNVLLDLFFKYTWNNFLHTQVQKCLIHAFNVYLILEDIETQKNELVAHILSECRLLQRILEAWKDNETQQTEHKRPRRGYMGHLIEIAKKIIKLAETHSFSALMKETVDNETLREWDKFVYSNLYDLQGPEMASNNHLPEKNGVGKNGSFGDFSQMLFSNYYQTQPLTPSFTGDFGSFQDNQNVPTESNDTSDRDFQGLENSSSDEDNEDNLERNKTSGKDDDPLLEFYKLPFSAWTDETDVTTSMPDCFNPWGSAGLSDVGSDVDWANFGSAPFVSDFGLDFTPDVNTTTTIVASSSHDIKTTPLALTPNKSNADVEEIFSEENTPKKEATKSEENNLESVEPSDSESVTNATSDVTVEKSEEKQEKNGGEEKKIENSEKNVKELVDTIESKKPELEENDSGNSSSEKNCVNCIEDSTLNEDVNSIEIVKEDKELLDNLRFQSPQSLIKNSEKEPEGEDSYQILKENVQAVPNETTLNCKTTEISSSHPEDKSANGPI